MARWVENRLWHTEEAGRGGPALPFTGGRLEIPRTSGSDPARYPFEEKGSVPVLITRGYNGPALQLNLGVTHAQI